MTESSAQAMLVLCTCDRQDIAESLAEQMVNKKLAACVSILPVMTSIYQWRGQLHRDQEYQLLIKIPAIQFPAIEKFISEQHPYDEPELIALPIIAGSPGYLSWLKESCSP